MQHFTDRFCSNLAEMLLASVLVFSLLSSSFVASIDQEYGVGQRKYKVSDKQFLQRQSDILALFKFINQESQYKNHQEIASTYSIKNNIGGYTNSSLVEQFLDYYEDGLLPRGEIFSVLYQAHLDEAISLFKLFYYAKDFDTFYKTAVWARNNVNEGLFLYALSTALVHRPDTYGFILPPIYEIYPHYFFGSEVIQTVQDYKQGLSQGAQQHDFTIQFANYSGHYLNLHPEQSLSYFLEDVGNNAFYYYCNVYYPFWMDGEEFGLKNDRRGEQYYYLYQQFLARYYLERLSNGFGEIEFLDYEEPFNYGYSPSLRYPNGLAFPTRPNFAKLSEYFYNYGQSWTFKSHYGYAYTRIRDYERRIRDSIDAGVIFTKDKKYIDLFTSDQTNLLGNVIEGNPDSPNPRYYGPIQIYARHLLGYSYQPLEKYKTAPSALEHFETALRDPAFYQLYKRIVLYFQKYKAYLPPYTYNDLYFPGVTIDKIEIDQLLTYFDFFYADISNAVQVSAEEFVSDSFKAQVRQKRLNHKPFTYKITVSSDKTTDAVVRIYLGPKFDKYSRLIDINENRLNFIELDTFIYKLERGKNVIKRNSRQLYWYVPDRTTFKELYKRVLDAVDNTEAFQLDASEAFYGLPNRLLLPKGKPGGQTFQLYVIINPYKEHPYNPYKRQQKVKQQFYFHKVGTGKNYFDDYAFGFPFDRIVKKSAFKASNSKFQDVDIYHKDGVFDQQQDEP